MDTEEEPLQVNKSMGGIKIDKDRVRASQKWRMQG